ncbi:hypothetical protein JOC54_000662 [Alkalihalobacillus xiaoxiensis]|uniref:Uncharacterized protein n=1 Tax=Shouchella xiaoxiensis TaxID=766895 RepID=A0ABS2SQX2_9BACI|nr:hypothetical protein [Shouchella xiaoxiensis]
MWYRLAGQEAIAAYLTGLAVGVYERKAEIAEN